MLIKTHHNEWEDNMGKDTLYINNVVISPCSKERKELLRMAVMRMLMPTRKIEVLELDLFTENPNPCPF